MFVCGDYLMEGAFDCPYSGIRRNRKASRSFFAFLLWNKAKRMHPYCCDIHLYNPLKDLFFFWVNLLHCLTLSRL